jgi:hypothetical protein
MPHKTSPADATSAFVASLVFACFAVAQDAQATSPLRPGAWELVTEMHMPPPFSSPKNPQETLVCFTPKYVSRNPYLTPDSASISGKFYDCKKVSYLRVGNSLSWAETCKGAEGSTLSVSSSASVTPETIQHESKSVLTTQSGEALPLFSKTTGTYKGECSSRMRKLQ